MMKALSRHDMEVVVNAAFVRDNEVHKLIGSGAKLDNLIGSRAITPLRETLAWMLHSEIGAA
jgi:GDP-D-mannose dehydratase